MEEASVRTDDDSWDITESVGVTAIGVAAMRARETARPDALFRDPYAERLVAATGCGWRRVLNGELSSGDAGTDSLYRSLSAMLIARTVYFDNYFTDAAAAGIRQLVILASGLDARAYRIEWPSGSVVFELDQPKVLSFKQTVLADVAPRADRCAVAVDLRHDWPRALRDSGFDPARPTAWLAEGLLRYLPADAQDRLFADLAALSAPGSRMALNIGRGSRVDSPALRALRERRARMLAEVGIDMRLESLWYPWEGRTDPRDWFATHGWEVAVADPAAILSERGREQNDETRAELNRHILMTATLGDENR
nr:class I SAM-dependent methyltransferase [Nocardia spumae]